MKAKIENGQLAKYPYSLSDLRKENPNTMFPNDFEDWGDFGVVEVTPTERPVGDVVTEIDPVFQNGEWVQQWSSRAHTSGELAEIRNEIWTEIKALRDNKILNGGYFASGKWFHSDLTSRTQQFGLLREALQVQANAGNLDATFQVDLGGQSPVDLNWKTMDGSFIPMTANVAFSIFAAAKKQDTSLFGFAEYLKAQVNASSDPWSIDINVGWPATYSE